MSRSNAEYSRGPVAASSLEITLRNRGNISGSKIADSYVLPPALVCRTQLQPHFLSQTHRRIKFHSGWICVLPMPLFLENWFYITHFWLQEARFHPEAPNRALILRSRIAAHVSWYCDNIPIYENRRARKEK